MNRAINITIFVLLAAAVYFAASRFWDIDFDRDMSGVTSLAIMPFRQGGDENCASVLTVFNDALIRELAEVSNLKVTKTDVLSYMEGTSSDNHPAVSHLGVDVILEGAVTSIDNRIRVSVQLLDRHEHLWSGTYDRELDDIPAITRDIAQSIARLIEDSNNGV